MASTDVIRGIGVDAVDIARFRVALERTPSMRGRVFVEREHTDLAGLSDPTASYAARFAVREAVMKAMGVGLGAFGFHDVWVEREESGRPLLHVEGAAADLARERGIGAWQLSITHTDTTAIAFVVATA